MVKPIVTTMLICEKVITDSRTATPTLVNVFNQTSLLQFPSGIRGCAFAVLNDGKASADIKMQFRRLNSDDYEDTMVVMEGNISFDGPLRPVQVLAEFVLPVGEPGAYALELFVNNEYLSSVKLRVAAVQESNIT